VAEDNGLVACRPSWPGAAEGWASSKPISMNVLALPSSRRPASQRRRAPQIIEAAARVFADRGFHGATTQDIADVLGIRQASLYYYFSSKEAALELVCLKGVEGFFEAGKKIAAGPGSAPERLALLINSHLSPLLDRGDFVKVFLNERQHLPTESRRRIGRWSRGLERIFEDVIKEGVAQGEFRFDLDTRLAALAVLGMCNATPGWYRKEGISMSRIGAEFAHLVIDGMRTKPKARRRRK
jgi:AcrR family transcriptional regulator